MEKEKKKPRSKKASEQLRQLSEQAYTWWIEEARQAHAGYEFEKAIELYTKALEQLQLESATPDPATQYDLLEARANCYRSLANYTAQIADQEALADLARRMQDVDRLSNAYVLLVEPLIRSGNHQQAEATARMALEIGQESGRPRLIADGNIVLGRVHGIRWENKEAHKHYLEGLSLSRQAGYRMGEGRSLNGLSSLEQGWGNYSAAYEYAHEAVAIARELRDARFEAEALNNLGLACADKARRREYLEQTIAIYHSIGEKAREAQQYNNLSLVYADLGLYSTAAEYARLGVDIVRQTHDTQLLSLFLDTYGRPCLALGLIDEAKQAFNEGLAFSESYGDPFGQLYYHLGLGAMAVAGGQLAEARQEFENAVNLGRTLGVVNELATGLGRLGEVLLKIESWQAALPYTAEAVALLEKQGNQSSDLPVQETWWQHYQVLRAACSPGDHLAATHAHLVLERAKRLTLEGITGVGDAGLRRNYMNKVKINREIILEAAGWSLEHGQAIEEEELQLGNLQEQLKRLLSIGVRMNEQRSVEALLQFSMDQLIELTGAERAALVSQPADGDRRVVCDRGFEGAPESEILLALEQVVNEVSHSQQPQLKQGLDDAGPQSEESGPLQAVSVMCVPLTSGGRLSGMIYVDNHAIFGRFTTVDLDLLATFANQAAAALENAELYTGLEQRVAERTAELQSANQELEQRFAELAVINAVQQGLSTQLEFQGIVELVGDKLREVFNFPNLDIRLYDPQTDLISYPYMFEHGKRIYTEPQKLRGISRYVIRTRQPIIINQDIEKMMAETGSSVLPGTDMPKSLVAIPILAGDQVFGLIYMDDSERENAFGGADVRLLTTLASSMSVALQNARLFEQIQQRATEMAALSEIGREVSATLDLGTVLERISSNAGEVLQADLSAVFLLDPDGQTLRAIAAVGSEAEAILEDFIHVGEGIIGGIAATGIAERIQDTTRDPRSLQIPGTGESPEGEQLMVAPLFTRDKVVGVMAVWREQHGIPFTGSDLEFLIGLARQAAIAIQNARLYEEAQNRAEEMAALEAIGRDITATLDLPLVMDRVLHQAADLLDCPHGFIYLVNREQNLLERKAGIGVFSDDKVIQLKPGEGLSGQVWQTGQPIVVDDYDHWAGQSALGIGLVHSMIGIPLFSAEEVVGVLALASDHNSQRKFGPQEVELLNRLGQLVAIAIQNARLFEEIQHQKQYSEALVRNSPVAIITTDQETRVVSWNPAAERLFGYTAGEAIGQCVDELINTPQTRKEAEEYTRQALTAGGLELITRRTRKDGSLVDVELLGLPILVDGQSIGMLAIYHDITELLRARQEAESANQAKSAFLATMSHEIRTPMNGVIGMASLLLSTELSDEQHEYAEIIRSSGDALLSIINDILDFSKIEAGKMELEQQPFDVGECIEKALDVVTARVVEKGLELSFVVEPNVPATVVGDSTRLRQILLNVLSNAVKFTEHGEVVLTVSGDTEEPAPSSGWHTLQFAVRDTGIGIPQDRQNRLFQSFSQVDASTSRKYGGTGLGLAISLRLCEMMGGKMWVESSGISGEGATVYFTVRAEALPSPVQTRPALHGLQSHLEGKRALIVDDNDTNRRILVLQLRNWGLATRDAASPQVALDWVQRGEPFDLAILDMQMPEMDGLTLAGQIRKTRTPEQLPLILCSSLGRKEAGADALGFAANLTKPVKPSQLLDTLVGLFAEQAVPPREDKSRAGLIDREFASRIPLRILLAEDNAVNQKLALRILQQMGYLADVANNGLEVLQSLDRRPYDLILMDVQMPEMDGLEATRQIVRRWARPSRPWIVAMTANAMQGDREMCLQAGMDDYIAKPIRIEELVEALSKARPLKEEE